MVNVHLNALTLQSWKGFLELFETYGEAWCLEQLECWVKNNRNYFSTPITNIDDFVKLTKPISNKITLWFLEYQFKVILDLDKLRQQQDYREIISNLKEHLNFIQKSLISAKDFTTVSDPMIQHIINLPEIYPPIEVSQLICSLTKEKVNFSSQFKLLVSLTKKRLNDIISNPRQSGDWSINIYQNCKCKLCDKLHHFLKSNEQFLLWPLAKDGRQHIHNIIEDTILPITHVTKREGSPYKLALSKKKELFAQSITRHKLALTEIKRLEYL